MMIILISTDNGAYIIKLASYEQLKQNNKVSEGSYMFVKHKSLEFF